MFSTLSKLDFNSLITFCHLKMLSFCTGLKFCRFITSYTKKFVFRYLVSFSINFTLFGVGVVFLLLASENIVSLINSYTDSNFSFCYMCVIVAAALTPVCWLGTPADFWYVIIIYHYYIIHTIERLVQFSYS